VTAAIAVILGVSVLGERFTPAMGGAFALILGGSVLATRGRGGAESGPAAAPDAVLEPVPGPACAPGQP